MAWRRSLLTFPGWGLIFSASCWRSSRAASAPRGHAPSPRPPSRVLSARCFRATSRGVLAAPRPLSLPAGYSLTQRVGRLVPCGRWNEDRRGELGCGGNAVSSPGAAGCRESRRPRESASAPYPGATSEAGLWNPGPGAAEHRLRPTRSVSSEHGDSGPLTRGPPRGRR